MRHRVKGRHLGRTAAHRRALKRNLVIALFQHGRIRTTDAKAREVRPFAERMITLAKRGDLHARRLAVRVIGNGPALDRLFGPIAERFSARPGGYTRLVKAGRRLGDAAPLAYLELLEEAPRAAGSSTEDSGKRRRGRGPLRRARGAAEPEGDEAPKSRRRGSRGGDAAGEKAAAGGGRGRGAKAAASGSGQKEGSRRTSGKSAASDSSAESAKGARGRGKRRKGAEPRD